MRIIRYPGSKAKLVKKILDFFPVTETPLLPLWSQSQPIVYCEPFLGSGAMALQVLPLLSRRCTAILSDVDVGLYGMWRAIKDDPNRLRGMIAGFIPSVSAYEEFKRRDATRYAGQDYVVAGFEKLALHQLSFSGLGARSGGPLGGFKQESDTTSVECRWRADTLIRSVVEINHVLAGRDLCLLNEDFEDVIDRASTLAAKGCQVVMYLDPPYYAQGKNLYKHWFDDADHRRLARLLKKSRFHWILSYDEHPFIRELYDGFDVSEIHVKYTTAMKSEGVRPKNREIVICSST